MVSEEQKMTYNTAHSESSEPMLSTGIRTMYVRNMTKKKRNGTKLQMCSQLHSPDLGTKNDSFVIILKSCLGRYIKDSTVYLTIVHSKSEYYHNPVIQKIRVFLLGHT